LPRCDKALAGIKHLVVVKSRAQADFARGEATHDKCESARFLVSLGVYLSNQLRKINGLSRSHRDTQQMVAVISTISFILSDMTQF
jgi:hypothetical protein